VSGVQLDSVRERSLNTVQCMSTGVQCPLFRNVQWSETGNRALVEPRSKCCRRCSAEHLSDTVSRRSGGRSWTLSRCQVFSPSVVGERSEHCPVNIVGQVDLNTLAGVQADCPWMSSTGVQRCTEQCQMWTNSVSEPHFKAISGVQAQVFSGVQLDTGEHCAGVRRQACSNCDLVM